MTRNIPAAVFGEIPGIRVGKWWPNRAECCADNIHAMPVHGVYGRKDDGVRSVVLSGQSVFEDEDHGETFTYIGSGGRAPGKRFGPQTQDQTWHNNANAALRQSCITRRPVRVIRGKGGSRFAPYDGFRYDGLYIVSNPRIEFSQATGFFICKFDFTRQQNQDPLPAYRGPTDKAGQEERREQYWRDKRAEEGGDEAASPSPPSSPLGSPGPANDGKSDDEDELEALFTSDEAVEEALTPVHSALAKFSRSGEVHKAKRRIWLVQIGNHIRAVVQEKEQEGDDAKRWNEELWTFAAKYVPTKDRKYEWEQLEASYEKFAKREQLRLAKSAAKSGTIQGTAVGP